MTVAALGGLYTLVYNSGGPPAGSFEQFDDAAWQRAYEQNLLGCVAAPSVRHCRTCAGEAVAGSSISHPRR